MSKRIDEITVVNSASNSANVLIEDNGMLKRMPASNMGGSGSQPPMILYFEGIAPGMQEPVYSSYINHAVASRYDIIEAMISGRDVLVVSSSAEPGALVDQDGNPLVDDYGYPVEPPFGCYKAISMDYSGELVVCGREGIINLYTSDDNYM